MNSIIAIQKNLTKENKLFLFGSFFLFIAPIISIMMFLSAFYIKYQNNLLKIKFKNIDKKFVLISFLMILGCSINSFFIDDLLSEKGDPLNVWIDLLNWLPFFIFFYLFKPFVRETINRKNFLFALFLGTAPIMIVLGWLQILDINDGSLNLLGGLIRWFPYAAENHTMGDAINPIFKNSNYSASGLIVCFAASLSCLFDKSKNRFERISLIILFLGIIVSILLTRSSVAILCLSLCFPIFIGIKKYKYLFFFLGFVGFFIVLISLMQNDQFFREFNILNISSSFQVRISIWAESLKYILQKPFFGWGAGAFPLLSTPKTGYMIHHAHNIFLETAFNYGIPTSFLMMNYFLKIPINTYKKVFNLNKNKKTNYKISLIDRTWITTTFLLIIIQFFDMQIYDGRINLCLWLLISGCYQINIDKNKQQFPN